MNNESGRESQLGGVVTWNMKRELRMRRAVQIDDVKTMKQAIISPYNYPLPKSWEWLLGSQESEHIHHSLSCLVASLNNYLKFK